MIKKWISWLRTRALLAEWRRRRRRGKSIRLNVGNLKAFFKAFEDCGVKCVVLRWFNEAPLTAEEEKSFNYKLDIDILIDTDDLKKLASIAARHPGKIKCDVYSVTGRRGMSYSDMPYYPPVLGAEILTHTDRYRDTFNVPAPLMHFRSLAYHLVYHKGLYSGIPSGCHLDSVSDAKRNYGGFLADLGQTLNLDLKQPLTLLGLHEYLKQSGWDMPYDLLERWPRKTAWHEFLLSRELESLREWAEKLPDLLIFFIREDVVSDNQVELVCQMLSEKFTLLKTEHLDSLQSARVTRAVRGGNWLAHKGSDVVGPQVAVLYYDFNPVAIDTNDEKKMRQYPHVKNQNIFHKQDVRLRLAQARNVPVESAGIHGSDNAFESQHMLQAIYADKTTDVNRELFEKVQSVEALKQRL